MLNFSQVIDEDRKLLKIGQKSVSLCGEFKSHNFSGGETD